MGGQVVDIMSEAGREVTETQYIHAHKTGALLKSVTAGAIPAGAKEEDVERLGKYAQLIKHASGCGRHPGRTKPSEQLGKTRARTRRSARPPIRPSSASRSPRRSRISSSPTRRISSRTTTRRRQRFHRLAGLHHEPPTDTTKRQSSRWISRAQSWGCRRASLARIRALAGDDGDIREQGGGAGRRPGAPVRARRPYVSGVSGKPDLLRV